MTTQARPLRVFVFLAASLASVTGAAQGLTYYTIQDLGVLTANPPPLDHWSWATDVGGLTNGNGTVVCGVSTKLSPEGEVWQVPVVFAGDGVIELPSPTSDPIRGVDLSSNSGMDYIRTDLSGGYFAGKVFTMNHQSWYSDGAVLSWDGPFAGPTVVTPPVDPCSPPGQLTTIYVRDLRGPNIVGWAETTINCDPLELQSGAVVRYADTGFLDWLPMDFAIAADDGGNIGGWLYHEGRRVACLKTAEDFRLIGLSSYGRTSTDGWGSEVSTLSPLTEQVLGYFDGPYSQRAPFIYNGRDTVTIAGSVQPMGANDAGQVVLSTHNHDLPTIQLWTWREDKVITLDQSVVPQIGEGWVLNNAVGIAADGRIAASASKPNGEWRAILLVPDTLATDDPPIQPLQITGWKSLRTHGNPGQELPIALDPAKRGNGSSGPSTESRLGGVRKIEVSFDRAVYLLTDHPPTITDTATGLQILPGNYAVSLNEVKTVLTIDFTVPLEQSCFRIDLLGAVRSIWGGWDPYVGDSLLADCYVRALVGDANSDGSTDLIDVALVKSKNGLPADLAHPENARYDVNWDGAVNLTDMALVKSRNGTSVTCGY